MPEERNVRVSAGRLEGLSIVVTGASSGLGREAAIHLSGLGARIVLVGRNEERLNQTLARLNGSGHRAEVFDIGQLDRIDAWMAKVASQSGPLFALVHCAGSQPAKPLKAFTIDEISDALSVNTSAAIVLVQSFRKKNIRTPEARIVLLSSVMGMVGQAGRSVYSACKSALIGFVRSAAVELAREKVLINCIAAGLIETEGTTALFEGVTAEQKQAIAAAHPLGLGKPADVAQAVAFLLGESGRWITGSTLVVDGGYTAQ